MTAKNIQTCLLFTAGLGFFSHFCLILLFASICRVFRSDRVVSPDRYALRWSHLDTLVDREGHGNDKLRPARHGQLLGPKIKYSNNWTGQAATDRQAIADIFEPPRLASALITYVRHQKKPNAIANGLRIQGQRSASCRATWKKDSSPPKRTIQRAHNCTMDIGNGLANCTRSETGQLYWMWPKVYLSIPRDIRNLERSLRHL